MDFQGVSFVVNVDFPRDVSSYTHRIGRTARGGLSGTALSLVANDDEEDGAFLAAVQGSQPQQQGGVALPQRLPLDISEIESFRYRVTDVRRAVTKAAIR